MNIQTPIARNTDPGSSHEAAILVSRTSRGRQCVRVTEMVMMSPGKTSMELAMIHGEDRHMVARRLSDCKGVTVKQGEMRKCRHSNRSAMTWLPIVFESL